jgi:hypothetical protein
LRATSSYKAGTISLHKGKALRVKQNVVVYVISCNNLTVLLNQRHVVLLSNKALCVLGVIATMQLCFTAEKQLEILIRRPNNIVYKGLSRNSMCAHSDTRMKLKYLAYFPVQRVFRASGMDVSCQLIREHRVYYLSASRLSGICRAFCCSMARFILKGDQRCVK